MTSGIFTKKATEKLRSPDDLENYVRVTNPSAWITLGAFACLFVGLFAWGLFGTVSTSIDVSGTCLDGDVIGFIAEEQVADVHVGDAADVGGVPTHVASMGDVPVSYAEALDLLGSDYLASKLVGDGWAYIVRFDGASGADFREGTLLDIRITTERVAPLSLVFGGKHA